MRRRVNRCALALLTTIGVAAVAWPASASLIFWTRVENGNFSTADQLRAWTVLPYGSPNTIVWSPYGYGGFGSGSVIITENSTGGAEIQQCMTSIVPGANYTAEARWYAAPGQPVPAGRGFIYRWVVFFATDKCTGPILSSPYLYTPFGTTGSGGWQLTQITAAAPSGARSARIVLGVSNLEPTPAGPITVSFDQVNFYGPYSFVKGSFLNRGETDLLWRNRATNEHVVWFMNDERLVGQDPITPAVPAGWQAVGVDDFDRDGKNDLLMWNSGSGGLNFWLMNGIGRRGDPIAFIGGPGPNWKPSATADLNHDGKPDILMRDVLTQQIRVWALDGTNHIGTLTPSPAQAADANWDLVGASDLNGDGNPDFLWYNSVSGSIVYWLMDASLVRITGNFTSPSSAGNNNWKVVAMGDYGIGPQGQPATQDIVWRNSSSGRTVVWFMDRLGNRTSGLFAGPETPPQPIADWTVVGPR